MVVDSYLNSLTSFGSGVIVFEPAFILVLPDSENNIDPSKIV